jgi:transglutaminase-like putative cysteine protease
MILRRILLPVLVFYTGFLFSQKKELYDALLKKYPNSSIVGLNKQLNVELNVVEGVIKIVEKVKEETILLKDDAISYESYSIYSSAFIKTKNIEARTFSLKGNSYKDQKNENIELQKDNSSSSFFDDQKKHIVHFDNLGKGAIRSISYERIYEEPRFFGDEYLCDYYPEEKREINIKCAKSIELEVKFFNVADQSKYLTVTEDSKYRYYSIKMENIPEYKSFRASPGIQWYLPHVVYYIKSYNDGKEKKEYLNNVTSLYNWYTSLIKHLPAITDKKLMQITDSLTTNTASERESVKNVFYWVQKNIKYIAFEDGMGGFVPRDASVVFQKKYGDCKDMAFLIYSMLRYKNIDGYLTWIGTRNKSYSFTQVPTPLSDDHMIACYKEKNGGYIFLDATDKQVKFGYPSSFIQGKQGLVATQLQFKDTVYVPVIAYDRNVSTDSSYFKINGLEISGKCVNYFTGYSRVNFINSLTYLSKPKKEEYILDEYEKGNNKFFISNQKEDFFYNDSTAKLNFDFTVKDYVKKLDKELYINMNIEQNTETYHLDETFTTPYEMSENHTLKYVKVLEIPENYRVDFVPENFTKKEKDYQLMVTYEVKGGKIINTVQIIYSTLLIPQKEIPAWNSFVKSYRDQAKQIVVLKQN